MMSTKTLFLFTALIPLGLFAQVELLKSSVSPIGEATRTSGNLSMIDAGGETANREADAGTMHLSEGFIGPDLTAIMGVEDYGYLAGVRLYPNPVKDFLRISLPQKAIYEIYVHSLTGRELFHTVMETGFISLDWRRMKPGMYLVSILNRQTREYVSFKVQKD